MDQEELEKMFKIVFDNVNKLNTQEGQILALTEQRDSDYKELEDLKRAREITANAPTPLNGVPDHPKLRRSPWLKTKTPGTYWCKELEAHLDDLKMAKQRMNGMWYGEPRGTYKYGSIFIKL